jgi:hypothetical protein
MITVSILKTRASKASFRASLVPATVFDQIGRAVNSGSYVAQAFVVQKILIEQNLVKDYPFIFEACGSRPKIILFGGVKKIVGKVLAQTVVFGLIIEVSYNQNFRIRILLIDRTDNFVEFPGQRPTLFTSRSGTLKPGGPVIDQYMYMLIKKMTLDIQNIASRFLSRSALNLDAEGFGIQKFEMFCTVEKGGVEPSSVVGFKVDETVLILRERVAIYQILKAGTVLNFAYTEENRRILRVFWTNFGNYFSQIVNFSPILALIPAVYP